MTELEHVAAEAWAALLLPDTVLTRAFGGGPPPAGVALDMVQDVTGDRDDAVIALLAAAARWLDARRPDTAEGEQSTHGTDALAVSGYVRCESYGLAESAREGLHSATNDLLVSRILYPRTVGPAAAGCAAQWGTWCVTAKKVIDVCRAVSAAAHPVEGV